PPEFDPEFNPESQDDSALDEAPGATQTDSLENPVTPDVPDVHDLPTLIDLESNFSDDDDETSDLFPVNPAAAGQARTDPRRTLPGSGGYDPNPDFEENQPQDGGQTLPHMVPFEHTLVHVPGEEHPPRRDPKTRPPTQRRPQSQQTIPAPPMQQNTQPGQPYQYPTPQQPQPQSRQPAALPPRQKPKARRILGCSPGCAAILIGLVVTFCGGLTLVTLLLTATLGTRLEQQLQTQVSTVDDYRNFQSTFFYDRTGKLLYEAFNEGKRTNVSYDQFPQDLLNATVAIEDSTFFTNPGFEIQATARAFLQYVGLAKGDSGGSTITQQVVRNILFSYEYRNERSIQRKVEEILLAFLLRQKKTPQQVMELYLNEIYYGNLAYGAEAASQTFFGKDVNQLTLGEAALLAGLPQAPADLDPLSSDPQVQAAVDARWHQVLDRMVVEHFITTTQRDQTLQAGITYNPPEAPLLAPHFTVYAQQEFASLMHSLQIPDSQIASGGFRVYTTVDLDVNDMAQQVAKSQIANLAANNATNSAVMVIKPV
ncbi:MAG: transglycosylase domain-containing protein, partial [Chloroflexota bacterium]